MVEIYTLYFDRNLNNQEIEELMKYVSIEKREKVKKFYHLEDAQRSLLGDILARYGICNRSGKKNENIFFITNKYGKPLLSSDWGIHFNISHSGSWVTCAIGDYSIGVDVERVKPIGTELSKHFFTSEECGAILNENEDEREKYFYKLWTLKESYIKAEGKGLSIPLNSFTINIGNNHIYAKVNSCISNYVFKQFSLDDEHICSICSENIKECNINNSNITNFMETIRKSENM